MIKIDSCIEPVIANEITYWDEDNDILRLEYTVEGYELIPAIDNLTSYALQRALVESYWIRLNEDIKLIIPYGTYTDSYGNTITDVGKIEQGGFTFWENLYPFDIYTPYDFESFIDTALEELNSRIFRYLMVRVTYRRRNLNYTPGGADQIRLSYQGQIQDGYVLPETILYDPGTLTATEKGSRIIYREKYFPLGSRFIEIHPAFLWAVLDNSNYHTLYRYNNPFFCPNTQSYSTLEFAQDCIKDLFEAKQGVPNIFQSLTYDSDSGLFRADDDAYGSITQNMQNRLQAYQFCFGYALPFHLVSRYNESLRGYELEEFQATGGGELNDYTYTKSLPIIKYTPGVGGVEKLTGTPRGKTTPIALGFLMLIGLIKRLEADEDN